MITIMIHSMGSMIKEYPKIIFKVQFLKNFIIMLNMSN